MSMWQKRWAHTVVLTTPVTPWRYLSARPRPDCPATTVSILVQMMMDQAGAPCVTSISAREVRGHTSHSLDRPRVHSASAGAWQTADQSSIAISRIRPCQAEPQVPSTSRCSAPAERRHNPGKNVTVAGREGDPMQASEHPGARRPAPSGCAVAHITVAAAPEWANTRNQTVLPPKQIGHRLRHKHSKGQARGWHRSGHMAAVFAPAWR